MAKYAIEDTTLSAIAEAIREKSETADGLTPVQMPGAIRDIKTAAGVSYEENAAGGLTAKIG